MLEMLSHSFMQRALAAGLLVAMVCPAIGLFLVLRRLSQYGDTLAHVTLVGVAAGVLGGVAPSVTGLGVAVLASLGLDRLRQHYSRYSELSLAIMAPASLALAVVLLSLTGGAGADVMRYLFGSIMTVTPENLYLIGGLAAAVMLVLLLVYKELLSVTFDEELARVSGLPVRLVNTLFLVLTALTVAMAMSVVGALLVSALIVIPVATALQVARSFRGALLWSVGVGVIAVVAGLLISYWFNLMPGGTVALTAVTLLLLVMGYKRLLRLE
jgi:zinc transport system permease protein